MSRRRKTPDKAQNRMAKVLDDLQEFDDFQEVLKRLRRMFSAGATEEEMIDAFGPMLTARKISLALTSENGAVALAAVKDIEDRKYGKATEKKEISHKFDQLADQQLNSILLSELSEADLEAAELEMAALTKGDPDPDLN